MSEIFKKAAKQKLRFATRKGLISAEDLYDLSLQDLDKLAITVNKELKETEQESFISNRKTSNPSLSLQLEILKEVIKDKLEAAEAAKVRADKRAQLARLKDLAASKEDESLAAKSREEILKMIADLESEG